MKKRMKTFLKLVPILLGFIVPAACLSPIEFNPDYTRKTKVEGDINITDVTSAVLMLTNKSKTVDVTNVTITQPEWMPPANNPDAMPPGISFAGKPKRLEKKAQYLAPSDKSYCVVIDYKYDALNDMPEGTGTETLCVPLPIPQKIVEYIIYRDKDGVIIIDKETVNPDPNDTGNPSIDTIPGEGSSPAEIPPEYRTRLSAFIVVNMSNSQNIDSVNFKKGEADYTMGGVNIRDRQSIALSQGSWVTLLKYTRDGTEKTVGPRNSIVVPPNDPQAIKEHYLYFYLNKRGDYAVTPEWPPFPNDVDEEDMLPTDNGYGRGMIEIINKSYAMAETVTIQNLKDSGLFPYTIDYDKFTPPVPVQYNKTSYVDVIGTPAFPIEAHDDYLIQILLDTSNGSAIVERKAYIKDQIVTIIITGDDLNFNNARGAKVTLENKISSWSVDLINLTVRNKANSWQSSYYGTGTWEPGGAVAKDSSADQYVMSSTAMPITKGAEFEALVTMHRNGVSATVKKDIMQSAELYSESSPDRNIRTITVTDTDVPQSIKDADADNKGATVILKNNVISWPVEIIGLTVRNKNNPAQSTYYNESTWQPGTLIGKNQISSQTVTGSTAMPITPNAQFEAVIVIRGSGRTETVPKDFSPAELYSNLAPDQNTRTLTLTDSDIPPSIKDAYTYTRGAKVTIVNATTTSPVQIIGMTVQNGTNNSQFSFYGENTWDPHTPIGSNGSAAQMVRSSPAMPITATAQFEAILYLFANNKRAEVKKAFSPAVLYSDLDPEDNTRSIRIEDTDVPSDLQPTQPPIPDTVGAKVTLRNDIVSWPVQIIGMTVQNKTVNSGNTSYGETTWEPTGRINRKASAEQMVYSSNTMPIFQNDQFKALVTLYFNGTTANITKAFSPEELYSTNPTQNTRIITVTDSDVPQLIKDAYILSRGATVTVENRVKTAWPVQITYMTVRNRADNSQKTDYNSVTWEPKATVGNGQNAVQTVMSSIGMPIRDGVQFEAVLTLLGNGNTTTVTKVFDPAVLYSTDDPADNTRTVTINDSDVPPALQTTDQQKPDIGGANNGDIITIDGIEWIKVRTDGTNSNLVLLMLKGVTGPSKEYDSTGMCREYGSNPSIKGYVDTWYAALNSPTLKRIAWKVNFGTTPYASWPLGYTPAGETNYVSVAFIPRLADITLLMKANGYKYWLSDIKGGCCIIKGNGDSVMDGIVSSNSPNVFVRPCIWVTSR